MKDMCDVHEVANQICGGPHRYVETDLGDELLAPGEIPKGRLISAMSKADKAEHKKAVKDATPKEQE